MKTNNKCNCDCKSYRIFDLRKTKKKAQAEAFGLILVVALIFVVIIILAKMEQNRKPSDIKKNYELNELSSSTINTLFTTEVQDCYGKTFSEVLVDCVKNPDTMCEESVACERFVVDTRNILNNIYADDKIAFNYRLTISSDRSLPELLSKPMKKGDCAKNLRGEDFVLPLNPGTVIISLVVCGN